MKINGIIIAKNEEQMITSCIQSLSFCDEVVVIDSGSSDKTISLAKQAGAVVYEQKSDDFSVLRNYGKEKAKGEWLFYIDADERVSKELAKEIITVISHSERGVVCYTVPRANIYYHIYTWPQTEKLERLFRKPQLNQWRGKLHETAIVDGTTDTLHNPLFHYSRRSFHDMLAKTIVWSQVEADLRLHANHPTLSWWRFPRVMLTGFLKAYIKDGGWKMGTAGVIEGMYQMFSMFVTYAQLWEKQQKNRL